MSFCKLSSRRKQLCEHQMEYGRELFGTGGIVHQKRSISLKLYPNTGLRFIGFASGPILISSNDG